MLAIEMLAANEGDALIVSYGQPSRTILVDCGRKTAYRAVAERVESDPELQVELFVLTHVDADHIAGAIPLLQDRRFGPDRVRDVWFNGWRHLNGQHRDAPGDAPDVLGARQGEFFSAALRDRGYPWNEAFDGHRIVLPEDGPLPTFKLAGGMRLTLLGPTADKLAEMRHRWQRDLLDADPAISPGDFARALERLQDDRTHGPDLLGGSPETGPIDVTTLADTPFGPDESEPNGSSISFLAEFEGKAVLCAGDAHAPQLAIAIRRLLTERGLDRLPVDAFKLPHHGSARNNSSELFALLDCPRYLISTDGARHHHPDRASIARALHVHGAGASLYFNYRSEETEPWAAPHLQAQHGYQALYPEPDRQGLRVEL